MIYRLNTSMPLLHTDEGGSDPPGCTNIIDENSDGYVAIAGTRFGGLRLFNLPSTNKLFVYSLQPAAGTNYLTALLLIDISTWTIDKSYTSDDFPNTWFSDVSKEFNSQNCYVTDKYIVVCSTWKHIMVIDIEEDTSWGYDFFESVVHSLPVNVKGIGGNNDPIQPTEYTWLHDTVLIDGGGVYVDGHTLYLCRMGSTTTKTHWEVCHTDLRDPVDGYGFYWFTHLAGTVDNYGDDNNDTWFEVFPDENRFMISSGDGAGSINSGNFWINRLSDGSAIKFYNPTDYPNINMWFWGTTGKPTYLDGKIYAGITYHTDENMGNNRGMQIINTNDDSVEWKRPTYQVRDDYGLRDLQAVHNFNTSGTKKNMIIMGAFISDPNGGVVIYDINTGAWQLWNSDNVGCFLEENIISTVAYDESTGKLFFSDTRWSAGYASEEVRWF